MTAFSRYSCIEWVALPERDRWRRRLGASFCFICCSGWPIFVVSARLYASSPQVLVQKVASLLDVIEQRDFSVLEARIFDSLCKSILQLLWRCGLEPSCDGSRTCGRS